MSKRILLLILITAIGLLFLALGYPSTKNEGQMDADNQNLTQESNSPSEDSTSSTATTTPSAVSKPEKEESVPLEPPKNEALVPKKTAPQEITSVPPLPQEEESQVQQLLWGTYAGPTLDSFDQFEALVGGSADIHAIFWAMGDAFPPTSYRERIGDRGKILLIFWDPSFGYDNINDGSQDAVIQDFLLKAKAYEHPILLAPFSEMNIDFEAWGYGINGNTPEKFKAAWKRIYDVKEAVNAANVSMVLTYNNVSLPDIPGNQVADYYPGDEYVDYLGVDGFNFGRPWRSFAVVFDDMIHGLQQYNKEIYIMSMASAESRRAQSKSAWITEGLGEHIYTYENVLGWVWFDLNKERDWRVNSSPEVLKAFQEVIPK